MVLPSSSEATLIKLGTSNFGTQSESPEVREVFNKKPHHLLSRAKNTSFCLYEWELQDPLNYWHLIFTLPAYVCGSPDGFKTALQPLSSISYPLSISNLKKNSQYKGPIYLCKSVIMWQSQVLISSLWRMRVIFWVSTLLSGWHGQFLLAVRLQCFQVLKTILIGDAHIASQQSVASLGCSTGSQVIRWGFNAQRGVWAYVDLVMLTSAYAFFFICV